MLAAMVSITKPITVYVQLLGEGTVVFRPAPAESVDVDVVRLLMPDDYDPEDEDWEFKPGATVRVEARSLSHGQRLVAVSRVKCDA